MKNLLNELTNEQLIENILSVYNLATEAQKIENARWYEIAYSDCAQIGETFGIDTKTSVAVCAVLSSNNSWNRNLIDLVKVLSAYNSGQLTELTEAYQTTDKRAYSALAVGTYSPNIEKAYRILRGDFSALRGIKVEAFFNNIYFPESSVVTIDFHAYSIATGIRYTTKNVPTIKSKDNARLQEAYITASDRLGILPKQLQAITWVIWRQIK